MKKLFFKISIFFLIVFVVDAAFGVVMKSTLAATKKGDWGRRNYIINESHEDILIFGSSRAIHHYNTKIISDSLKLSCYNCGDDGKGILMHYPILESILQRYTPKIVIYDLTPSYDYLVSGDINTLGFLRPYADRPNVRQFIEEVEEKDFFKLNSQLYKYNSCFIDIISQCVSSATMTADKYTYAPLEGEMSYEPGSAKKPRVVCDSVKLGYLEKFIDLCRGHNIKLYFVVSPWYKMEKSDLYVNIEALCEEKNVRLLNHNFDEEFNLKRNYFHDPSHLNRQGAEAYSSIIAHEIIQKSYLLYSEDKK